MPTSANEGVVLVDTSVAVALSLADHEHHRVAAKTLRGHRIGLAGHAAFETFSVLTRLPPPGRRSPAMVEKMLRTNFPETRFLSAKATKGLYGELAKGDIAGGAIYDALVGAVAREHGLKLISVDRRARETYRALGIEVELLG
ncbi:MAG: type II toxin-antitoxin system VapC family toxin [Microthrixaceae bacterium]